jgi:NAD(P)H-flavin reductase
MLHARLEPPMFADELEELQQKLALEVVQVASQPSDDWRGVRGRIHTERFNWV